MVSFIKINQTITDKKHEFENNRSYLANSLDLLNNADA